MTKRTSVGSFVGMFFLSAGLLVAACGKERPSRHADDDDDGVPDESSGSGGGGSAQASSSTTTSGSGGMDDGCGDAWDGECETCIETSCCSEAKACQAAAGCMDCVTGNGPKGCSEAPAAYNLLLCGKKKCDCFAEDEPVEVDLVKCTGPASTMGTVAGVTPDVTIGDVQPDPSGNLKVGLYPHQSASAGDILVGVYFFAKEGKTDYLADGYTACIVYSFDGSSYSIVESTQKCTISLTKLQFASMPDVCDGMLEGTFEGHYSKSKTLTGSFQLPLDVAKSQTKPPPCKGTDKPCSTSDECCSKSCSLALGVCN